MPIVKRLCLVSSLILSLASVGAPAFADDSDWQQSYSESKQALRNKHFAASKKLLEQALSQAKQLPSGEEQARQLFETYAVLTGLYDAQRLYSKADEMQRQSLAQALALWGPVHPFLVNKLQDDAHRYLRHRQPVEAEKLYRQAIEVQEKLGFVRLLESAITLSGLAKSLQMQHRYDEAEVLFRKCLMKYCSACKDLDCRLRDLAGCYAAQGRIAEARPFYKRAREVELQYKNLKAAMKMSDAADLLRVRRQFRKSESLYLKALAVTQKYSQPNSEQPEIMRGYAFLLSETGRKAEALELKGKAKHLMDEYYKVANVPTGLVMQ